MVSVSQEPETAGLDPHSSALRGLLNSGKKASPLLIKADQTHSYNIETFSAAFFVLRSVLGRKSERDTGKNSSNTLADKKMTLGETTTTTKRETRKKKTHKKREVA